jgi:hypothetical protein
VKVERVCESMLVIDFCHDSHVVLDICGNIKHSLIAKASGPDGERVTSIILLLSIIEDNLYVGGPLIIPIDGHLSSWKHDSINFA